MKSKDSDLLVGSSENADWLLRSFVRIVNKLPQSLPITINVGGAIISGDLIGGKEYFSSLGGHFATAFSRLENSEEIGKLISGHGNIYNDEEPAEDPQYLHLKNTVFFDPEGNSLLNGGGALWRGRISKVDGFIFGKFERA